MRIELSPALVSGDDVHADAESRHPRMSHMKMTDRG
jgi:hypothetical protein